MIVHADGFQSHIRQTLSVNVAGILWSRLSPEAIKIMQLVRFKEKSAVEYEQTNIKIVWEGRRLRHDRMKDIERDVPTRG